MLGRYDNFPENIHRIENFKSTVSRKELQEKLVQALHKMNCKAFSFEEIGHQALRGCTIIFEAGIAESKSFNFMDEEETKKLHSALKKASFQVMDFFLAIRYYRNVAEKKTPLKFDYYLLRTVFGENSLEIRAFHERGPRYISPEDIIGYIVKKTNDAATRKILKEAKPAIS